MDRFSSLRVFVRTVDLGGLARAARELRLSPAMVGKHIASLETQFSVRLLHRTTRRITLTEVGLGVYNSAILILGEFDEMTRAAETYQSYPTGHLRITAPVALADTMGGILANFLAIYSNVTMDIICDDRVLDMSEQKLDLAIRVGRLPDSSLIARKLAPAGAVVCASPAYLSARGIPTSIDDLNNHDCIAYEYQWAGGGWAFANANGIGERVVKLSSVRYRSNNAQVQRALVLSGKGLAQMPAFVVEKDIKAGRLIAVLTSLPQLERWVHAVYQPGGRLPLSVRALVDFLIAHFRNW
ncbi:LysR family transcriptional regulator [Phyllobacterium sp. TAF24]|uniref:LysR family transcriptional regulator n=1 Tax=Phyllobacterium sp. TAF24 TaxID=3233068 RepID=UPI003F9CFF74